MPRFLSILLLCALGLSAPPARAQQEGLDRVETEIRIAEDGTADVRHQIRFTARGDQIRRGLFFNLPKALGPVQDIRVFRDDAEEAFEFDDRRLRIGDEDVLLRPGPYRYDIRYRLPQPFRALEDDQARLRYQPIVAHFEDLPWQEARLSLLWPSGFGTPQASLPGGAALEGTGLTWTGTPGRTPRPIILDWPRAAIAESAVREQRETLWLKILAPLAFLIFWAWLHRAWTERGRDAKAGQIWPSSQPPKGLSPGACRYVERMRYDPQCLIAALISLKVKGALKLSKTDKKRLTLERLISNMGGLTAGERAVVQQLFKDGATAELKPGGRLYHRLRSAHAKALEREYGNQFIEENADLVRTAWVIAIPLALVLLILGVREASFYHPDTLAGLLSVFAAGGCFLAGAIYASIMKAPTKAGRTAQDRVEGLRRYLADDTPLPSADRDADHFLSLLPYAVALDCEEAWNARFGADLPPSSHRDSQALIDWYQSMKRDEGTNTVMAAVMPAILASGTASGTTGVSAGGVAGGGW